MSFEEFCQAVAAGSAPPPGMAEPLVALWHDRRGDWTRAHAIVQADDGPEAAWVHAYLHRKEGDAGNAAYWYRRAGRPVAAASLSLDAEWAEIAGGLLQ